MQAPRRIKGYIYLSGFTVKFHRLLLVSIFLVAAHASAAFACPKINGLIDYNCDEKIKIAFTGDSIVRGVGDLTKENEGYVERLRQDFPLAEIENLGVPGITSTQLLRSFKKLLKKNGPTTRKSENADLFIIQVGPNDYWKHEDPALTVRNIKRIIKYLEDNVGIDVQSPPLFAIATLLPTKRPFQAPFIKKVNVLLKKMSSSKFPVKIRFDTVSVNLISKDGIHPSPAGYDAMATIVKRYLKNDLPRLQRARTKDADLDGVYDYFETQRFMTNPKLIDSDGDGVIDGQEIFYFRTNPLEFTYEFPIPTPTPLPTATPTPGSL